MSSQKPLESDASRLKQLSTVFKKTPILTSFNSEWSDITLEAYNLPPGETPEFYLDHYVVSINIGKRLQMEQIVEGKAHQETLFHGTVAICPIHCSHSFHWDNELQSLSLNLNLELLSRNAIALFGTDCVELIPHFAFQDQLIYQIGLALQEELGSQSGGRLYAETMANALAVHLLRDYSTQRQRTISCKSGVPRYKMRLVIEYINDYLEYELSLGELSEIAQMSQYHFCRAFKQATGLSPHQYLIHQRVERAKQLLQRGGMSLGAVAIACGFTHQSHFHRHFKRLTGVTPKTFLNS